MHNPTIDAKASMQLTLLKLRQGLDFGDVIINGCTNLYDEVEYKKFHENHFDTEKLDLSDPATIAKFIYQTGLNIDQDLFKVLNDNLLDGIYIENQLKRNKYLSKFGIKHQLDASNIDVFNSLTNSVNKYKFVWSEFFVKSSDSENNIDIDETKKILKYVRHVYDSLNDDTMLMVAFTGRSEFSSKNQNNLLENQNASDLYSGRCFLRIKSDFIDKLDDEIKELYSKVNPNKKLKVDNDDEE
jgi:hypothetical protein